MIGIIWGSLLYTRMQKNVIHKNTAYSNPNQDTTLYLPPFLRNPILRLPQRGLYFNTCLLHRPWPSADMTSPLHFSVLILYTMSVCHGECLWRMTFVNGILLEDITPTNSKLVTEYSIKFQNYFLKNNFGEIEPVKQIPTQFNTTKSPRSIAITIFIII